MPESNRQRVKAAIRRAERNAQARMNAIDRQALSELEALYRAAREDITASILQSGDQAGRVRLEQLRALREAVERRLTQLSELRNSLLDGEIDTAARIGILPASEALGAGDLAGIAEDAARTVRTFVAEDGLQLSDRLWRLDRKARTVIGDAVERAVIQGHSASRAAQEFLQRGEAVPADVLAKLDDANASRLAREAGRALMTGEGNPYENARRVFRTEINRAHGLAYQESVFRVPDVVGTKFQLSPRHPEPDICDMHARVNRYGLGPGVYPKGKSPWPAHPNTMSFETAVFADEVSEEDRAARQKPIDWLQDQSAEVQAAVLGGRKKAAMLRRGVLKENQINTPWRVLKRRLERQGVDIDG